MSFRLAVLSTLLVLVSCAALAGPAATRTSDDGTRPPGAAAGSPIDAGSARLNDPFPELPGLRGNVDFWIAVWSEWTVGQAVIHDSRYPALVYEIVELPGPIEDRYTETQREFLEFTRDSWSIWLERLERRVAEGAELDELERRWVDHIREAAGPDGLLDAADRIRSQRGLRERFRAGLERSYRYLDIMRGIFRVHDLPEDLAYLPHVESSFQFHARSSVGATGIWQFTRGTGRKFMTVTNRLDERLDAIRATHAAAAYLREAYAELEAWPLALTSYNHGVAGMKRAKAQFGTDFEAIYADYRSRSFGFASRNFYAEFLAAREIARHPGHYFPEGFTPADPMDLDLAAIDRPMSPRRIARAYGLDVDDLVELNPAWTRRTVRGNLPLPTGTSVWMPRGTLAVVDERGGPDPDVLAEHEPDVTVHTVRRGESLSTIAARYGTSVSALRTMNDMPRGRSTIHPGQVLQVRGSGPTHHVVKRGDTLSGIAEMYRVTLAELRDANDLSRRASVIRVGQKLRLPGDATALRNHVVRRGETLLRIAATYGVRLVDLLAANTLSSSSVIHPGQTLVIPTR